MPSQYIGDHVTEAERQKYIHSKTHKQDSTTVKFAPLDPKSEITFVSVLHFTIVLMCYVQSQDRISSLSPTSCRITLKLTAWMWALTHPQEFRRFTMITSLRGTSTIDSSLWRDVYDSLPDHNHNP